MGEENRGKIQRWIREIVETTRCTPAQAEIALLDTDNNLLEAVTRILESTTLDTWTQQKNRKEKKKEQPVERKSTFKGNQQRKGHPRQQDGIRFERGNKDNKENINGRSERRPRTEKSQAKEDVDDSWKAGPRVFERKEVEPPVDATKLVEPINSIRPTTSAVGTLSFAAIVAKQPKRDPPKPIEPPQQQESHPVHSELIPKPAEVEPPKVSQELKSPKKATQAPSAPISFNGQHDAVDHSLTDQLKNDLGLGASFGSSFHSTSSTRKEPPAPSPKNVIEWASGPAPSEVFFDFAAGGQNKSHPAVEPPKQSEYYKQEAQGPPTVTEPIQRSQQNLIGQGSQIYTSRPAVPPPQQLTHNGGHRERRAPSNNLSFSDTSSVNYQPNHQDYRPNGSNPYPNKAPQPQSQNSLSGLSQPSQTPQQSSNQPSQQLSQSSQQQAQQHHLPSQPPMMPNFFPYVGMYNPYQQFPMDFNALGTFVPPMPATSTGPLPGSQNTHQQNQNTHQRFEAYNDRNPSNLNSALQPQNPSQNQSQSLGQTHQRQQNLENNAQSNLGNPPVPPPGFPPNNIGAHFFSQHGMGNLFHSNRGNYPHF